jgi:hypothetical protein
MRVRVDGGDAKVLLADLAVPNLGYCMLLRKIILHFGNKYLKNGLWRGSFLKRGG